MVEFLKSIDLWLFYAVNHGWKNPILDRFMPFITAESSWLLVYVFALGLLFWKGGRNGRLAATTLIITVIFSDQFNSSFVKELFGRIRPCHVLPDVYNLVGCGPGKSFPSSHAVNNFAAAVVISQFYKKNVWIFYLIAVIVSLSRVYVGVHYPSDITAGAIEGAMIGFCIAKLIKFIDFKFIIKNKEVA